MTRPGPLVTVRTVHYDGSFRGRPEIVVGEEPLQIRVQRAGGFDALGITMRTPGQDFNLVAGVLFTEGIIAERAHIETMRYCTAEEITEDERFNVVLVRLRVPFVPEERHQRLALASSACGVCGKAALSELAERYTSVETDFRISAEDALTLVERMEPEQRIFEKTGGIHAAALFDTTGRMLVLAEDIGRHNAVDKSIGRLVLDGILEKAKVLVTTSRTGYEIVQKAVVAQIPVIISVSAPSSLAISLAHAFGITLVAFMRHHTFNVYTHPERIVAEYPEDSG